MGSIPSQVIKYFSDPGYALEHDPLKLDASSEFSSSILTLDEDMKALINMGVDPTMLQDPFEDIFSMDGMMNDSNEAESDDGFAKQASILPGGLDKHLMDCGNGDDNNPALLPVSNKAVNR